LTKPELISFIVLTESELTMKATPYLLLAALSLLPIAGRGAETAQARMYCLSLRFQRSMEQNGLYTLDLTTLTSGVNGELAFGDFFGNGYSHSSFPILTDEVFGDQYDGGMDLDIPPGNDVNRNTYPDFFEVSLPVNTTSSGIFNFTGFGSGTVAASWSRSAGSQLGTCFLTFRLSPFETYVFAPTFELIEYTGPLTYTPGSNTVSGSVNLTQTGNPANQMQGPVQFVKAAGANHFNNLTLQPGGWTNADLQSITFANDLYVRFPDWPTNYGGYFDFNDWDPNTPDPDYLTWGLSIDDTNDVNHNGIPDFSDDPQSALPSRPLLALARTATNVLLTIHGDVGHLHQVQEVLSLASTNWQTVTSVTLTTDPQVVPLPFPTNQVKFWRVQAQ